MATGYVTHPQVNQLRTAAIALIIMMAQVVASWAKEGVLIGINNTCHSQNKTCF